MQKQRKAMPITKNLGYAFLCFAVMALLLAGSCRREVGLADPSDGRTARAEADDISKANNDSSSPGTMEIPATRQQVIGVKMSVVQKSPVVYPIRLLGRVQADETRIHRINASVDGWITKVNYNTVGSLVKKGQVLATFTNPQFIDAEQSYLFAIDTVQRLGLNKRQELGRKETPTIAVSDSFALQRQMDALRGMGVGDAQLEEIGETRKITLDIRIVSPVEGFITARKVSPQERFLKGSELYQIADLRRVWIVADAYEREVESLRPGAKAKVVAPYHKRTFDAKVAEILPLFDATTRTLKVRLEADNPGYVLRPDMFVDVEVLVNHAPAIMIPTDAILDSGLHKTVFVDRGNGQFEPREVRTGRYLGNQVEIVSGLDAGERIVVSGNFLIDSESKLELAASGMQTGLSRDPVANLDVSMKKAAKEGRTAVYQGKTYYFSSDACKEQFEKAPGRYVKE
jgi:membrane fusion protein, copper/silver efflux system